ncbi:MAG: hypothetical protein CBC78_003440 [Candidatus Pelagibacter sp. TMED118]|nr:MAG: hypothetical protein CBC78_003440 [Candidatus Pelagibacter sp. TMED118]|tara:strand:+ start:2465 stop:3118 length:654 start_codon:yes stop_codon:yes gene_type:complete
MFLTIKNIPKVSWSSKEPLNLKPKPSTFFFLCFGLTLFGIGEGLLLVSYTGASPWSVLAQGISNYVDLSIGTITFFISLFVIILWIFLSQKPGIGTFLNVIIIAVMIDVCLNNVTTPESFELKIFLAIFAVIITGIGSGIYLIANLGPGPRDGLMTGLQKKTNFPIAFVRAFLEISVVTIGWYLGGTVGVGTILFAFGIGPCVAFGLYIVDKISTKR